MAFPVSILLCLCQNVLNAGLDKDFLCFNFVNFNKIHRNKMKFSLQFQPNFHETFSTFHLNLLPKWNLMNCYQTEFSSFSSNPTCESHKFNQTWLIVVSFQFTWNFSSHFFNFVWFIVENLLTWNIFLITRYDLIFMLLFATNDMLLSPPSCTKTAQKRNAVECRIIV